MDTKSLLIVLVPSILSFLVAVASIVFSFLRDSNKSDNRAWEAAKEITLKTVDDYPFSDERACEISLSILLVYKCLKKFETRQFDEIAQLLEKGRSVPIAQLNQDDGEK